jgi:ParB family chromosome partitioning protein
MAKPDKFAKMKQTAHAARMQERAEPVATGVSERLSALAAFEKQQGAPAAAPTVVETIVQVQERVPLEKIKDRLTDIRPVSEPRAQRFAGSIAHFGLIQPPAIDRNGFLLAGDHRRRALSILRELSHSPERAAELLPDLEEATREAATTAWQRFGFDQGVPVHRMDVDAVKDPSMAKAIELAENTNREDFSKDEVKRAYVELKNAGYRHVVGRPKKGEKAIGPELELLYGKASRTITKYIAELRAEENPTDTPADTSTPEPTPAVLRLMKMFPSATIKLGKKGGSFTVTFGSDAELNALLTPLD